MKNSSMKDPCEYNPQTHSASYENEVHASAELIVGASGQWRLCRSCAALPEFKRFKKKELIKINMVETTKCKQQKDWWRGKNHWEALSFTEHDPVQVPDDECSWWECSHCGAKLSK